MTAVKTIVATAVVVFALTAVAMAGVQHGAKAPSAQAASKAPVQYTVTLTGRQLAQLMGQGQGEAAATRTVHHARHAPKRHHEADRAIHNSGASSYRTYSAGSSNGRSTRAAGSRSSYRCDDHSGGNRGGGSGSHHGGGGCW